MKAFFVYRKNRQLKLNFNRLVMRIFAFSVRNAELISSTFQKAALILSQKITEVTFRVVLYRLDKIDRTKPIGWKKWFSEKSKNGSCEIFSLQKWKP